MQAKADFGQRAGQRRHRTSKSPGRGMALQIQTAAEYGTMPKPLTAQHVMSTQQLDLGQVRLRFRVGRGIPQLMPL